MSKPDIILLHGALGASAQLSPLGDLLAEHFNVHHFQFSGHGGKPFNSKGFSISVFSEELGRFIDENQLSGSSVFGYSMGGYVALHHAVLHQGKIAAIFTLATKFDWNPESSEREVKQLNPEKIEEKVPKFAEALKQRHQPNDWKEVLRQTAALMLDLGNTSALRAEQLSALPIPVLVGIGTEDVMVGQTESQWAAANIPGSQLKVFEGFKHPIEQVDLDILARTITGFLLNL